MSDSREYLTRGLQTSLFDSRMESVADSNVAVLTPLDVEESLELAARTPHLVIPADAHLPSFPRKRESIHFPSFRPNPMAPCTAVHRLVRGSRIHGYPERKGGQEVESGRED